MPHRQRFQATAAVLSMRNADISNRIAEAHIQRALASRAFAKMLAEVAKREIEDATKTEDEVN